MQKDILLAAKIKDVCTLLDTKANVEDINKILAEIHSELESKAHKDMITQSINDQAIINESLCTENIVGRWTWKSGEIKAGNLVPWEN